MVSLAYVDSHGLNWFRRWLDRSSPGEAVVLVEPEVWDAAQRIADGTPASLQFLSAEELTPERIAAIGAEELVIPRSLPSNRLEHFPGEYAPNLEGVYPLFSRFMKLGLKRFQFFGPSGAFRLTLPVQFGDLRDRHKGRRCFVVGNGPSLNDLDMTLLKDEITFGCNRCYLGYEKWGFPFTYWGISDEYQAVRFAPEYTAGVPADTLKFCPLRYLPLLDMENLCPVQVGACTGPRRFSPTEPLGAGHSVIHFLLQVAAAMGCNPIILIGVDHKYDLDEAWTSRVGRDLRERIVRPLRGTFFYEAVRTWREQRRRETPLLPMTRIKLWNDSMARTPTHFHDAYTGGSNKEFALPQVRETERDLRQARLWAETHGVEILNATPGTALKAFHTADFSELFSSRP